MPAYDQEQPHAFTAEYNQQILAAKIPFTYGDGITAVNEEHRTWSNAAGWGGMKSDADGSTTIHFKCEGEVNNITSGGGNEFNYIVSSYGASQAVIDEEINPINPSPVQ
jgi:hypothetical protein